MNANDLKGGHGPKIQHQIARKSNSDDYENKVYPKYIPDDRGSDSRYVTITFKAEPPNQPCSLATLVTDTVVVNNLPPTTSPSTRFPRHQVQPRKRLAAESVLVTPTEAARRGPGRPRKQPVGSPAVAEPTPAPVGALLARPPGPSSSFFSETSSRPVDATVTALPPRPTRLSDGNHSAYSHNQSDDEYRPDDKSGNEDLAEELAKIVLDDNLDCGAVTASEGLTSVLQDKSGAALTSASDVWYFMTSASSSTHPDGQKKNTPGSYERPSGEFLECYLCRYGAIHIFKPYSESPV
jgi:hypothetical protein